MLGFDVFDAIFYLSIQEFVDDLFDILIAIGYNASMKTTPILFYGRTSSASQVGNEGIPRQRESVLRWCQLNGHHIQSEFLDEGVSGTLGWQERRGLSALVAEVKQTGIKVIVLESSSRLSRDVLQGELALSAFKKLGCKVIAADSGTNLAETESVERMLIARILSAVAESEKMTITKRMATARDMKSERLGRRIEGQKPFGYYDDEKDAYRRVFQLRRKKPNQPRLSFGKIADQMTREGFKTRSGNPWNAGTVWNICKSKAA